jgi:hypothetical protein
VQKQFLGTEERKERNKGGRREEEGEKEATD